MLIHSESLHKYYDIYFVKKVMIGLINCEDTKDLFVKQSVSHNLRLARELKEYKANTDYIYSSSVFRLRRNWKKIVVTSPKLNTNY